VLTIFTVCDKPISECENWKSVPCNIYDHCHASDKGLYSSYYISLRKSHKRSNAISPSPPIRTAPSLSTENASLELDPFQRIMKERLYTLNYNKGPFKPDDVPYSARRNVTKCRKCGWYSLFDHWNYTRQVNPYEKTAAYPACPSDWCHACGRVASKKDFGKRQSIPYKPVVGDVLLGTKDISFKIKAHDPRKIQSFSKYWEENKGSPNWEYNEAEMENDFFRHRIGKHPDIEMILHSIPVTKIDGIPESGSYVKGLTNQTNEPSISETEALILDRQSDLNLLRELLAFAQNGFDGLGLTTDATWNGSERKGVSACTVCSKILCCLFFSLLSESCASGD